MGSFFVKGKEREVGLGSLDQGCDVKEKGKEEKTLPLPAALHTRGRGLLEVMCVRSEIIGNKAELNRANPGSGLVTHASSGMTRVPHITAAMWFPPHFGTNITSEMQQKKKSKPE